MVRTKQGELAITAFQLQLDLDVPLTKHLVDADLIEVNNTLRRLVILVLLFALEVFQYACLQDKVALLIIVHDFRGPLLFQVALMIVVLREHVVDD